MTMTSPAQKITSVRLDPDNREWLEAYARRTKRSLNGAVNFLIQAARDQERLQLDEHDEQDS